MDHIRVCVWRDPTEAGAINTHGPVGAPHAQVMMHALTAAPQSRAAAASSRGEGESGASDSQSRGWLGRASLERGLTLLFGAMGTVMAPHAQRVDRLGSTASPEASGLPAAGARGRAYVRVRVETMGPGKFRNVGKSQWFL
jgi:hypothetical protein